MFTNLHLSIADAEKISAAGLVIEAASSIGEEASVLRMTFVISLIITAITALMTLLWA